MNKIKSILLGILKGGDKALDVAGALHIPIAGQIDTAKDAIKAAISSGDPAAAHAAVDALNDLKPVIAQAVQTGVDFKADGGIFDSKKFVMAAGGIVAIVAGTVGAKFGVDKDLVELAIWAIGGIVVSHIGLQGLIDAIKAKVSIK